MLSEENAPHPSSPDGFCGMSKMAQMRPAQGSSPASGTFSPVASWRARFRTVPGDFSWKPIYVLRPQLWTRNLPRHGELLLLAPSARRLWPFFGSIWRGAWPFCRVTQERQRRFGLDLQRRHRHISGNRRGNVVCCRRLSGRSITNKVGGCAHQRSLLPRYCAWLSGVGFCDADKRKRLKLDYGVSGDRYCSRTWQCSIPGGSLG